MHRLVSEVDLIWLVCHNLNIGFLGVVVIVEEP